MATETEALEDFKVVQAMLRFGGSFAKALGDACVKADFDNLARIKAAFPELWAEYTEMAVLAARRD